MRSLWLMLLLAGVVRAADPLPVHSFETTLTRRVGYRYLLFTPTDYEAAPERHWPLLLFLHGAGERGDDPARVTKHGPPKLLHGSAPLSPAEKDAAALLAGNFIVLAPQCPEREVWDEDALAALLDDAVARLRVDRARIYATGLSMGGYGTWSLLARHPEHFAAIAPICGGGRTIEFFVTNGRLKVGYPSVAVWAFHGAKDPTVPLAESQHMIAAGQRAGMKDITLTVYPEAEHDSWTETYANPQLYAWLLAHRR